MTAKIRAFRVEDDLWIPAAAKAKEQKDNLSAVLRDALRQYLESENEWTE